MKTTALIIATIGCIALGVFGFAQSKKLQAQSEELTATKQQVATLEAELKEKSDAIENARSVEAKSRILQKTLSESTTVAVAESKKSEKLQASLEEARTNNPMHVVASMLKDPGMRDLVKSQQKMTLGPIIDQQYGDLFKQLHLTPEQSATFKDLVMKKMLAGTDAGLSIMDGSLDASQRAELTKQVKAQSDEMETEMKQFLGDNNYQAYQSYEKTVPDRLTMSQFNQQFSGTATALTSEQQNQMVQAMSDARNNFTWTSTLNKQDAAASGDIAGMLTDDNIAKFTAEREQFDQQFLTKAQQILTPDQYTSYQKFQQQQRDLQLMSFKMAKQLFNTQSQ
jgi:hypothetical protein